MTCISQNPHISGSSTRQARTHACVTGCRATIYAGEASLYNTRRAAAITTDSVAIVTTLSGERLVVTTYDDYHTQYNRTHSAAANTVEQDGNRNTRTLTRVHSHYATPKAKIVRFQHATC